MKRLALPIHRDGISSEPHPPDPRRNAATRHESAGAEGCFFPVGAARLCGPSTGATGSQAPLALCWPMAFPGHPGQGDPARERGKLRRSL